MFCIILERNQHLKPTCYYLHDVLTELYLRLVSSNKGINVIYIRFITVVDGVNGRW